MKPEIKTKIEESKTLINYLTVLQTNFDVKGCKPGRLVKATLIYNIANMLSGLNILITEDLKIKALNTQNLDEFINLVKSNYNLKGDLTPEAKKNLINNTEKIILLTSLKEI